MEEKIMGVDSASNRSNGEESLQRARETYSSRESEETKKHKQEIKRLLEAHNNEILKLQEEHTKNLDELKEKSKDLVTSHDMKYQKDIDELREMHQKQLSRNMQESDAKVRMTQEGYSGQDQHAKQITDRQRDILIKNYENELKQKDEKLSQVTLQSKDKIQDSNNNTKKLFTEQYEKDLKLVSDDRDRKVEEGHSQFERLRVSKDSQLNQANHAKELERNRLVTDFENNLTIEKEDRKASDGVVKQEFDAALLKNRDKYQKALDKNAQGFENIRDGIDSKISGRIDGEVKQLKVENQKLKADNRRDLIMSGKQKNIEIGHVIDDYSKNIEIAEKGRDQFVDDVNKKTHKQFEELNKKNDETVYGTSKYYKETIDMNAAKTKEKETNLQSLHETQISHNETQNNARFGKLRNVSEIEQQRLKTYYDNSSQSMHENFDERLNQVRTKNKEDQDSLFSNFNKKAQDNDRQFQEKLTDMTTKYESEISNMNDKHIKDMKDLRAENDRRLKEQTKFDQEEIEKQKSQLTYRLAKVDELHKKDISDINKRHEQSLATLSKLKGQPQS
jgi:hypothetical protein